MTFERSPLGQANRAIFYNVDWIIYTEGGDDEAQVTRSFDALFWNGIFKAIHSDVRFRAIPRGGKPQLQPLALQVASGELDNVIVTMDKDYDELFGSIIDHDRVIYTVGYSFETDIFTNYVLKDLFLSACPEMNADIGVVTTIDLWVSTFVRELRWPLKTDILAFKHGVAGFDRDSPQRYFDSLAYSAEPSISRQRLKAEVSRICKAIDRPCNVDNPLPKLTWQGIYGHLVEVFAFKVLFCLHARFSRGTRLTYEGLRSLAISHFQIRVLRQDTGDWVASIYRDRVRSALA